MFWSTATIGADEWKAKHSRDKDSAEKERQQFAWAKPWDPPDVKLMPLDPDKVAERVSGYKQGIIPLEALGISIGIDTGKRQLDWTAAAWRERENGFIVDYGEQKVDVDKLGASRGLIQALWDLRTYFESGWHSEDGQIIRPSQVWIDSGYPEHTVPVYQFCQRANEGCAPGQERYRPSKGYGEGQQGKITGSGKYTAPKRVGGGITYIGKDYHMAYVRQAQQSLVHIDANVWKSELHARLGMEADQPGAITLYETTDADSRSDFIGQLTAEEQVEKYVKGKGIVIVWDRIRRKNHKLDSTYAAVAAGHFIVTEAANLAGQYDGKWFASQQQSATLTRGR